MDIENVRLIVRRKLAEGDLPQDRETLDVKLDALVGGRAHAFHEELGGGNNFLAGVTELPVSGAAPEAGNAVMRQGAVVELAADGETDSSLIHGMSLGEAAYYEEMPDSPESRRRERQPKGLRQLQPTPASVGLLA